MSENLRTNELPEVVEVEPAVVGVAGGALVTVRGRGFSPGPAGLSVRVDGLACSDIRVVDDTKLVAVVPAHIAGVVDVEVHAGAIGRLAEGLRYVEDLVEAKAIAAQSANRVADSRFDSRTKPLDFDPKAVEGRLPARASITIFHHQGSIVVSLAPGERVVVGRSAPAEIEVPDANVSKRHARFSFDGEQVAVEDLGSRNGTFVNGERIERVTLGPGDQVLLGGAVAVIEKLARGARSAGGVLGHQRFVEDVTREIDRARHLKRFIALLMVSSKKDAVHVGTFTTAVQAALPPLARAALFSPTVLEVLVELEGEPHADARSAAEHIVRAHKDLVAGVAVFPGSAATVDELLDAALSALREARKKGPIVGLERGPPAAPPRSGIVAASAQMKKLLERDVPIAANTTEGVLILGETGAGKEVVARQVHERSKRAKGPFYALNCAALTSSLVESELFGTGKDIATGVKERKGAFELAHGGTLFLDEIGELPLEVQAKLLRVLAEKAVRRVGGDKEIPVDVRVVAATHRDLEQRQREGTFREDLRFRLDVFRLDVAPLRARPDDIPPLVQLFVDGSRSRRITVDDDAMAILRAHPWPGNVRELRNVVVRAVAYAEASDGHITAEHLGALRPPAPVPRPEVTTRHELQELAGATVAEREDEMRARTICAALNRHPTKKAAAAELGMAERTLRHNIARLGIRKGPDGMWFRDPTATRSDDDGESDEE